jgi:hypothetical protein
MTVPPSSVPAVCRRIERGGRADGVQQQAWTERAIISFSAVVGYHAWRIPVGIRMGRGAMRALPCPGQAGRGR